MPPSVKMGGAFGEICNTTTKTLKINSISSPYGRVEFHTMYMKNDMMKMKQIENPTIKAGKCFELKPGGNHIMLMNVKKQASAGDKVSFLIKFSDNHTENIEATVKPNN